MPPKIVVVGSFNTDLVMYMPELPQMGETVVGHRFVTGPGGKGSNQAVGVARLGAETTFICSIGNDQFAQMAHRVWERDNINTDFVVKDPNHGTGVASIFVEDSGEDMIAVASGANAHLKPEHIDKAKDVIAQADVLLTQLEVPQETVYYALKLAHDNGVKTILNPAPATGKLPEQLMNVVDYITPNETEAEKLTGHHGETAKNIAQHLLINKTQTAIVTLGAFGSLWVKKDESEGSVSAFMVKAVDAVGGGDAFNAGLAVGLAEGKSLHDAMVFANATGALAVTRKGASESMPARQEVETFIQQHQDEIF